MSDDPNTNDTNDTKGATWDSTSALPDERTGFFAKYKTYADVEKAHNFVHASYAQSQAELKAAQAKIAEMEAGVQNAPDPSAQPQQPQQPAKPKAPEKKPPTPKQRQEQWHKIVSTYNISGEMPQETLDEAVEILGLPEQEILQFAEAKRRERISFFQKVSEEHEGVDMEALEAWLSSGKSPFSANVIAGWVELGNAGDTGWVPTVWSKYEEFKDEHGGFRDSRTGRYFGDQPARRGAPVGSTKDVFTSKAEYLDALNKATVTEQRTGDRTELERVYNKAAKSPALN